MTFAGISLVIGLSLVFTFQVFKTGPATRNVGIAFIAMSITLVVLETLDP